MKNMKKFFSLVLAIVMVMALAAPVMAAEEHNHTITITETKPGHIFEAYQIFAGDVATTNGNDVLSNVQWGSGVSTTTDVNWTWDNGTQTVTEGLTLLEALQNQYINPNYYTYYLTATTAADVVNALSTNGSTAHAQFFAETVSKYLTTCVTSKAYTSDGTEAGDGDTIASYKIEGLTDGYYLVKEQDDNNVDPETHTEYMLRLVKDVTVAPKDGTTTVDKDIIEGNRPVDACTNNIGDVITFDIDADLPDNFEDFDTFYLEFADTLSAGLTLNRESIKLYTVNGDTLREIPTAAYKVYAGDEVAAAVTSDALQDYSADKTPNLVVVFEDLKALAANTEYTVHASTNIRLVYTATLNQHAEIGNDGNTNEVYLRYTRSPYDDGIGETEEDRVYVFTFQLDVTKVDGETNQTLKGVEFVLARERSGHKQYVVLNNDMTVKGWTNWINEADLDDYLKAQVEAGKLNEEDKAAKKAELMASPGIATTLVTGADGKFIVKGLDLDTYWLIETKPLEGYNSIEDIQFVISAEYDAVTNEAINLKITLVGKDPVEGDEETGVVATTVVNNPGKELPTTGGMGTTLFYVFGSIMVVGAAVLLITKKRMAA